MEAELINYLRLYGDEKYTFQVYLSTVQNVQLRKCLSRFWCSNHCLQIEAGRRFPSNVPLARRICKMCDLGAIEDEDHFLLVCPAYAHLRAKFIDHLPLGPITPVQELLSCQNQATLARYIEQCLHIRTS